MSAESAVLAGRALAEAQMVDVCTITRWDGTTSTNPNTGVDVKNTSTVYAGKCRVQNRAPRTQLPIAGETVVPQHLVELQVPMSVVGLRTGDVATIDASALDPDLVGRRFRTSVSIHKSHATMRRLPCIEGGFDG